METSASAQGAALETSEPSPRRALWLLFAAVAYVALLGIWPLAHHWAADPQYHFGYLVPLLTIVLLARRWQTRPAPAPCPRRSSVALAILIINFPVFWFLLQPNPDWRLLNWVTTSACSLFLIAIAAKAGGRPWARHFAFPALFLLTAAPWPTEIEWPVTQGLMRLVAAIAAEMLSLAGVPAIASGNVVEIASGPLGVDFACSGIRSLQPSLMMGLFLGELYGFSVARRVTLFLLAGAVAIVTNLGRVLLLAGVAAARGIPAIDQWHDPAGSVLMTLCFVLAWLVALALGRNQPETAGAPPSVAVFPAPRWSVFAIAWIALSVAAGAAWFSGGSVPANAPWKFAPPASARAVPLDRDIETMLRFDQGGGWTWRDAELHSWIAYDFAWAPGSTRSRALLSMHRPDICLAAVGLRLMEERGPIRLKHDDLEIAFQGYVFAAEKGLLHVYYALYRDGRPILENDRSVREACWRAVTEGRRSQSQHVLQLAISGCSSTKEADAALSRLLRQTIRARSASSQ